jgi:hypothetical protein
MLSVICVYSNRDLLEKYLLKSLKEQSVAYELILLDNTDNRFSSAAKALNFGAHQAHQNMLMFVHQDVELLSKTFLEDVEQTICNLAMPGIAGVAGVIGNNGIITNLKDGIVPQKIGRELSSPEQAQTLDECLFFISRSMMQNNVFDEKTCDDWHLYAVDYCLTVLTCGYNVYILPNHIYHRSRGYSFSNSYYVTLKKILKKHRRSFKIIYTSTGYWWTFIPLILQKKFPRIKDMLITIMHKFVC